MMNDNKSLKNKQLSDEKKLRQAIDFVEELSWLLESKNKLRLSEIPDILRDASKYQKNQLQMKVLIAQRSMYHQTLMFIT